MPTYVLRHVRYGDVGLVRGPVMRRRMATAAGTATIPHAAARRSAHGRVRWLHFAGL